MPLHYEGIMLQRPGGAPVTVTFKLDSCFHYSSNDATILLPRNLHSLAPREEPRCHDLS